MIKLKEIMSLTEKVEPNDSIKKVLDIVKNKQYNTVQGKRIDTTTAGIVKQVWDQANDNQKRKLNKLDIEVLVDLAFKMID